MGEYLLKSFYEINKSIWEVSNRESNYMIQSASAKYINDLMKIYNCPFYEAEKKAEVVGKENQLGFSF